MIYLLLFGLALLCVASIGSRSLNSFSRHILEAICARSAIPQRAERRRIQILKDHECAAVAAGMFRLLLIVATVFAALLSLKPPPSLDNFAKILPGHFWQWVGPVLAVTFALLLTECWLARAISKLWATHFVYYTWPVWRVLATLLYPLNLADRFVNVFFHRLAGKNADTDEEEAFEDEIRTMVTEGHREGLLEEDAREMIESVMELGNFDVSEIMTPRTDMVSIPSTLDWDEMLQVVISAPHSRIPVYKENRDDIVGVIHAKDLLREMALTDSERKPWTNLMKEPLFVPETKPVDTLLQEFQNTKQAADCDHVQRAKGHLAIVLDEYGGVSGIVTLEDILEEIVGEILDEHDPEIVTEEIHEVGPDAFEALGKVRIDELNETLHLDLPDEEDYDTIAGFIFSTLGHVPKIGETMLYEHEARRIRFTVQEATRRRIEKVLIERNPPE